jgi:hypothetical protein
MSPNAEQANLTLPQKVRKRIQSWAMRTFLVELSTDFSRAQTFTALMSKQRLAIVRAQPQEKLPILASILPLGVWSNHPGVDEVRKRLSAGELAALRGLETASAKLDQGHRSACLELRKKGHTAEFRQQFRKARRACNSVVKEIASKWDYAFASGGAGEWGLIHEKRWGRITVSWMLEPYLDLRYSISLTDLKQERVVFHDAYLSVLGIGPSEWANVNADQCPDTLIKASDFVRWHVDEYETLLEDLLLQTPEQCNPGR